MRHRAVSPNLVAEATAIFFDMNSTFMFGEDRFGPDQDYFRTYCAIGGEKLTRSEVTAFVSATYDGLVADYANPKLFNSFPSLAESIAQYSGAPLAEMGKIETVIARHEVGFVPPEMANTLSQLAKSHRLAVVSNVWAEPVHWESEFRRAGIASAFESMVFSSAVRAVKPSEIPFAIALRNLGVAASDTLFVGDSLERDIIPAKRLGMVTAWVSSSGKSAFADTRISSIIELLQYDA